MDTPEVQKEPHAICPHVVRPNASNGGGCAIYQRRPSACAAYTCLWLNGGLPYLTDRPDLMGLVVEIDRKLPTVAMVSEVWPGARKARRAQEVLAELAEALPTVVVFVKGENPIIMGPEPSLEDLLAAWRA